MDLVNFTWLAVLLYVLGTFRAFADMQYETDVSFVTALLKKEILRLVPEKARVKDQIDGLFEDHSIQPLTEEELNNGEYGDIAVAGWITALLWPIIDLYSFVHWIYESISERVSSKGERT